ncbi:hypothetical protein DWB85_06490 [Seongchinamella sediminis]|uniref:Protein kinase domain-containing protein n=1 Tax=Seongchinamella sediminis TaxID=2283635 RepID=A0A3L7E116_9GAMM|nr:RyR domain-containing protein [Seongchinamella sediminis]RLQ22625.1 hypothetical protein DWB85_06490 [Seongchinamella sediminis]
MNDGPFNHTETMSATEPSPASAAPTAGDFPAGESLPQQPGEVILGRFEVKRYLGQGAFGYVFLAYDLELDRLVAMKKPRQQLLSHYDSLESFIAEARTVAQLDHQHIVPVYDCIRTPEDACYIVSKFIRGQDLGQLLQQGRISLPETVRIIRDAALALHHAHLAGIVHCDIKPANVIVGADGSTHVTDFGIAYNPQQQSGLAGDAATPAYMSPEQADANTRALDGRTDIYALGVLLYQLMCGQLPFQGDTREQLAVAISSGEVRPPRQIDDSIPRELERICLQAIARDPGQRYTTALDLARDLDDYFGYEPSPIDVSSVAVDESLNPLIEKLAQHTHDIWALQRYQDGWKLGDVRDDSRKTHPCLVAYNQLPEAEKEYDRATVIGTIKAMLALGYSIKPGD